MDQKELQEKIALYYSKLPPKAQEIFSSMKWLDTLQSISQKYSLNEDQQKTLGTETLLVLLGITHMVEYEEMLTNEFGLIIGDKIFMEIENTVIDPIRPELSRAFEENKKSETNIEPKMDERFARLPKETQEVILGSNYQTALYDIAKGYNLNVVQMGILEKTVTDLIAGDIHPDKFEGQIESQLDLSPEIIKKLVDEITEKIFKKIRGKLIENTESKKVIVEKVEEKEGDDLDILNNAGIEIISDRLEIPRGPDVSAVPPLLVEEGVGGGDSKKNHLALKGTPPSKGGEGAQEEVHPIVARKLAGNFQIPVVETDHFLNNITRINKINTPAKSAVEPASPSAPVPVPVPRAVNVPNMPMPMAKKPEPISIKNKVPNADPYRELPE